MNESIVSNINKPTAQLGQFLTVSFKSGFSSLVDETAVLMHAANEFGVQYVCICLDDVSEVRALKKLAGIVPHLWLGFSSLQDIKSDLIGELPIEGFVAKFLDLQMAISPSELRDLRKKIVVDAAGVNLIDLFEVFDRLGCPSDLLLLHNNFFTHAMSSEQELSRTSNESMGPSSLAWLRSSFPDSLVRFSTAPHAASLGNIHLKYQVIADDQDTIKSYTQIRKQIERFFVELGATIDPSKNAYGRDRCMLKARDTLGINSAINLSQLEASTSLVDSFFFRPHRLEGKRLAGTVQPGQVLRSSDFQQKVGIFVQARVASSRLPQKALLPFHGELSCSEYLIKRLMSYPRDIGQIVLATTKRSEDDALEAVANAAGIPCLRGEDDDVLGRMVQTAEMYGWDVLVRVTGDDLFPSCECIEDAIQLHLEESADYTQGKGLPIGMNHEVLDTRTLQRIHEALIEKRHGEWVTWFFDHKRVCRYQVIETEAYGLDCERYRVTLDYREDYDLMREVARRCHLNQHDFYIPSAQIVETLRELDPDWLHDDDLYPQKRSEIGIELRFRG